MGLDNTSLRVVLEKYRKVLNESGAASGKVIVGGTAEDLRHLDNIEAVEPHPDLFTYYRFINGYDLDRCDEMGLFEPEFAWQMYPIASKDIASQYEVAEFAQDEDPDYWPVGFLPILRDCGGNYIVVNCCTGSPTYSAVYEMKHCVGSNRICKNLEAFIVGNTIELQEKTHQTLGKGNG